MNLLEAIQLGLLEITTHKFRSFLTMLGVVFGVAAVIAIVSIGEGARREAVNQLKELGTHTMRILPVKEEGENVTTTISMGGSSASSTIPAWMLKKQLSLADAMALKSFSGFVKAIAPEIVSKTPQTIFFLSNRFKATVVGTTPDYPEAASHRVARGRFLNETDMDSYARVAVLGSEVKLRLFGPLDPLGKKILIQNSSYTVIGVMQPKDTSGITLVKVRDLDKDIYIPITTSAHYSGLMGSMRPSIDEMILKVQDQYNLTESAGIVKARLTQLHDGEENFEVIIPEEVLRQQQAIQRIFSIVMGFIAAISLFVGGIGIMNIMLATVLQRTREIGIRRSIGANQLDILLQFLVEAVVISLIGGFGGIFLGFLIGKAITLYAGWRTVFSIMAVIISFVVSTLVGIIFGLYPAQQASRLHPVEALRYE